MSSKLVCKDCNVILITMTNLRYDHMSLNGYYRLTTPNLDKFAKESLVFDNAFGHSSWTLPESISLYTGLYPYQHGIMNRYDGSKLPVATSTLIDVLNLNGYKTAAFTGGFDYNPEFGLTNRLNEHEECTKGLQEPSYPRQKGPRITVGPSQYGEFNCTIPKAIEWLKTNLSNKFFLHVQGFDVHCPFSQKGGYIYDKDYAGSIDYSGCLWTFDRVKPIIKNNKTFYPVYSAKTGTSSAILLGERDINHLTAVYDEAITFADLAVGQLLYEVRNMGLNDKTIIIFTSEHGDMFGKQGRLMRGGPLRGTFYDDVLHIPLVIKNPKLAAKRIDGLVGHVDLMPTLFDFLGLKQFTTAGKSQVRLGKSLLPLILQNQEINKYIFAGSEFTPNENNIYFSQKTRADAVRNKEWKLIQETVFDSAMQNNRLQTVELYDIINDKEELRNLADVKKDKVYELQSKLSSWQRKIKNEQ